MALDVPGRKDARFRVTEVGESWVCVIHDNEILGWASLCSMFLASTHADVAASKAWHSLSAWLGPLVSL